MKSEILRILKEAKGHVSGQDLCTRFGVSRTAIWKVIRQLKEEGYEIEAVHNKGYLIVDCPDVVYADEVKSQLETKWAGKTIKYLETVDSTNNEAKRLAEAGAVHGTLVIADAQSGGKGRRGKAWTTLPNTTIAMTILLRPEMAPEKASMLTLVMGMAVAAACKELTELPVQIKWPNDVTIHGKKICGILTEMSAELHAIHYLVIGAGINVGIKTFEEELQAVATSLYIETGKEYNRANIIQSCMKYFEYYYEKFMETGDMSVLTTEYQELLVNMDKEVRVLSPGNEYNGIARGINEKGELLVEKADGEIEAIYAGEVSVRGVYGYV